MAPPAPVTDTLARFVATTAFSSISEQARANAKLHILDCFGIGLAFVLCRDLFVGGAKLVLIGGVATGTITVFQQRLHRFLVGGECPAGEGGSGESKDKAENGAMSEVGFQFDSPNYRKVRPDIQAKQ